ncbi:amidohydrolase family protein [Halosquirtibacter xylanolyticus]|uniref:amidohydrolase family protein n=1 Tax=Halosquirtibacter xylanolyticus TaxID=3374599 RepID=UPI003749CE1E|nr:amidohydrolase family protein [Prolixibacteraceae bacterium]
MRRLSAHFIFLGDGRILEKGVITCDDQGTIINIEDNKGQLREAANIEFYNGILMPGMVNAHCHLELSDTKGAIPRNTTLPGFIRHIINLERDSLSTRDAKARVADRVMFDAGISVIGDISNGIESFEVKRNSKILYHTFVEALGMDEQRASASFESVKMVYNEAIKKGLNASIVPHAPYSVSRLLMSKIDLFDKNSIISIHNQESASENQLFLSGDGNMAVHLSDNIGLNMKEFTPLNQTSIHYHGSLISDTHPLLLIHNTDMNSADIDFIVDKHGMKNLALVLCPKSNLYIENNLPDINMFMEKNMLLALGTDSLASNDTLSLVEEMKIIQNNFPNITLNSLIEMATINGAMALQQDETYGSIEVGKRPGIVHLKSVDLKNIRLTENSSSVRII